MVKDLSKPTFILRKPHVGLYFDIEDQEGLKLVLPYLKVRYYDLKSHKIKIKTPKDGEREAINEVLSLGDFSIEIVDVRRSDREVVVAMIWNSQKMKF